MAEKKGEFHPGQTIWVSHKDVGYTKGTILELISSTKVRLRLDEFDDLVEVDTKVVEIETTIINKDTLLATDDLTMLPDLHRPSLLEALRERFLNDQIYTYTGLILIAINPFKSLDLYGQSIMHQYSTVELKSDLKPHVYFTAKESFKSMRDIEGKNQSILVSGESGAGKTVTTKIVLDYLTTVSDEKSHMSQKIIKSNPVLEAFGNAKTLRNDNSSRFGKLIQLSFSNQTLKVNSCKIDTYLLEKARVMHHAKGERNFHIFYELQEGLSKNRLEELEYIHPEDSRITNAHNRRVLRGDTSDKEQWETTLQAMKTVGLSNEEIEMLQRIVSSIMHLGELDFEDIPGNTEDAAQITLETRENAEFAAKLLEIPYDQLQFSLCSRIITLGSGKTVTKVHNVEQAEEARNAIAMALYERTFLWLVWKTNKGMRSENKLEKARKVGKFVHSYTISVLDIFGFEVFKINTFEQLFINYANEVLQQLFNEFVFKIEQQVYESEGIDWKEISFPDNSICIALVEDKKSGILKNLDDVCLMPKGTDQAFHNKVKKVCAKKFKVVTVDNNRQSMQHLFTVRHFAGEVEYSAKSFCLKNKNELRHEQIACLRSSENDVIRNLLPEDPSKASGAANASYFDEVEVGLERAARKGKKRFQGGRKTSRNTQKLQQSTVGNNFRVELNFAIEKIKASELHFIRCIKPNDDSLSNEMDRKRTLEQLNYSGVLEAVRISRLGYSSRFFFNDFARRFFILQPPHAKRLKSSKNTAYKGQCLDVMELNGLVSFADYQIGHSKVFLKADAFAKLEMVMRQKQAKSIVIMQRSIKSFLFRRIIQLRIEEKREEERKRQEEERRRKIEEEKLLKLKKKAEKANTIKSRPRVKTMPLEIEEVASIEEPKRQKSRARSKARSRTGSKKSKSSKNKSRRPRKKVKTMNESEALGFVFKQYVSKIFGKLKGTEVDGLAEADIPFLLGLSCLLAFLFFNVSGIRIQAVFNFLFFFLTIFSAAIFTAQMKLESDKKRMERYEVYSVNKNKSKEFDLLAFDEDELQSLAHALERRDSKKSSSSKRSNSSKRSRRSRKRRKSGSKRNRKSRKVKLKDDVDAVEMSTAEVIALNQTRRRIQSMHSLSKTQGKKFSGLLSKESMKEKSSTGLKKTNSRYGNLSYKFPEEQG